MEPTATAARRQRAAFAKQRAALDTGAFSHLLGAEELGALIDVELPAHRVRTYPPALTLSMFLSQTLSEDGSCQGVLEEHLAGRIEKGGAVPSGSTGAYCRARRRLPTSLITTLCRRLGRGVIGRAEPHWRWQGRRTLLVDGTTVSMPDTPENQRVYPQPSSQEPGLGFPLARVVALGCLASGALLEATVSPAKGRGSDEQGRFRVLMSALQPGDVVVLGDAAFESYWAMVELAERGVDAVFEINGMRKLPGRSTLVTLRKPKAGHRPHWMTLEHYRRVPSTLRLRQVRAGRKGAGKKKTLLTTMIDTRAVSNREIERLYRRRWEIELDLRSIKQRSGDGDPSVHDPSDGDQGAVGPSVGLQSDPHGDGGGRGAPRARAAYAQLPSRPAAVGRVAPARGDHERELARAVVPDAGTDTGRQPPGATRAEGDQTTPEGAEVAANAPSAGATGVRTL